MIEVIDLIDRTRGRCGRNLVHKVANLAARSDGSRFESRIGFHESS